jgi:hypothetical protein
MADLNDLTTNVNIWDDAKSKSVTVTTDGSKERLDVDARMSGGGSDMNNAKPKFTHSKTPISLTAGVDTSLVTITDEGYIDFISVLFSSNATEIILKVDGTEILRVDVSDIDDTGIYDLRASASNLSPAIYTRGGSHIIIDWNSMPSYFATSVQLLAKHADSGKEMTSYFIRWREVT